MLNWFVIVSHFKEIFPLHLDNIVIISFIKFEIKNRPTNSYILIIAITCFLVEFNKKMFVLFLSANNIIFPVVFINFNDNKYLKF